MARRPGGEGKSGGARAAADETAARPREDTVVLRGRGLAQRDRAACRRGRGPRRNEGSAGPPLPTPPRDGRVAVLALGRHIRADGGGGPSSPDEGPRGERGSGTRRPPAAKEVAGLPRGATLRRTRRLVQQKGGEREPAVVMRGDGEGRVAADEVAGGGGGRG